MHISTKKAAVGIKYQLNCGDLLIQTASFKPFKISYKTKYIIIVTSEGEIRYKI